MRLPLNTADRFLWVCLLHLWAGILRVRLHPSPSLVHNTLRESIADITDETHATLGVLENARIALSSRSVLHYESDC